SIHASSPRSVTLTQLRFTSLAVASSREDLHLQECARAGRTNGAIAAHPRGTLEHRPREQMLSPRVYRKGGNYEFQEAFWLVGTR
ncbi:MAG: hypothetical protein WCZ65_12540, partial [Lysobacteraceae bacterium]